MFKKLVRTLIILSVAFTANLFAASVGDKVSPSAINLTADGILEVTIHTTIEFDACRDAISNESSVLFIDDAGFQYNFPRDDLSIISDSQHYVVVKINTWTELLKEDVVTGPAQFNVHIVCGLDNWLDEYRYPVATIIQVGNAEEEVDVD